VCVGVCVGARVCLHAGECACVLATMRAFVCVYWLKLREG